MHLENLTQSGGKPRARDLVRGISEAIARERLKPGERLPPQRDLAHSLGIAVGTVGRAYAELESAGLIAAHVGRGTFVVGRARRDGTGGSMPEASGSEADSAEPEQAPCEIDLLTYRVPIPGLPDLVAETLREIADDDGERHLLDNSPTEGDARHRAAMSEWLKGHGLTVDPASIVLTNGGQHAAVAAISTITHPGETIATEELTDPRMKAVAGYLDRRLAGVPCDDDGMIPEALEELCRKRRIAAIYCTPRNQNPMNTTMPAARRIAIAGIAETHDLPIVESDIYGTLCSHDDIPIAAIAPHRRPRHEGRLPRVAAGPRRAEPSGRGHVHRHCHAPVRRDRDTVDPERQDRGAGRLAERRHPAARRACAGFADASEGAHR
jgi:DNA-binding transcriptional MocR family regulator